MTLQQVYDEFLCNKEVQNYQLNTNTYLVRMVKVPIVEGIVAVYAMANWQGKILSEGKPLELVCVVAHDKYPLLYSCPFWCDELTKTPDSDAMLNEANNKLHEAAQTIIKQSLVYTNDDVLNLKRQIADEASRVFFSMAERDSDIVKASFYDFEGDEVIEPALALPDYNEAAKLWLNTEKGRKFKIRAIVKKEGAKLAAEWEANKTTDLHIMREIKNAIADKNMVFVTLDNGKVVREEKVPTIAFETNNSMNAKTELPFCCIDTFAIAPEKTRREVEAEYGWRIPIRAVTKIRYRGKSIWEQGGQRNV